MKKIILAVAVLLTMSMLAGCSKPQNDTPITTESSVSATESTESTEGDASAVIVDTAYTQQIDRYFNALSVQWEEGAYFAEEMSPLAAYYYEGNALDNVGYALIDMNGDETKELIIGAIKNAENDPVVFEIWTLKNGEPVMLAQSGYRNRYYMQYAADDDVWSVANEAENGAANHAVYYLQLTEGEFAVNQGIVFDAVANENAPWFITCDMDWDTSNDESTDEDTANAVMEAERNLYTAVEYIPYSQYK